MTTTQRPLGPDFEQEVRNVARALWPSNPGDGAPELILGRDRDCIFYVEDLIHYVECTTQKTMEKVRNDANKMIDLKNKKEKQGKLMKLWIVTYYEPTPDQKNILPKQKH